MELSDAIKKKLSAMSDDYKNQLPDHYNNIIKSLRLARTSGSMDDLDSLRLVLHKLSGSGATFGFDDLTTHSKKLVRYLDSFLRRNTLPTDKEWEGFEGLLVPIRKICVPDSALNELDELEEIEDHDECIRQEKEFVFEERGEKKIINFYDIKDYDFSETFEQLGYYGFVVEVINDVSGLSASLAEGHMKLLIVHIKSLKDNLDLTITLKKLKDRYEDAFSLLFISQSGDFSLRMAAVRSGADAFFEIPFDIGRFVDKIDSLISIASEPPYHILLIDDDPDQISYYAYILQQAGMITSVATDPQKVLQILIEAKPELILMDMYMPTCSGIELSSIIRQQEAFVNIPIIFFSVETHEDKRMEAYKFGADGFITKPVKPEHLLSSIKSRAERNRSIRFLMERDSLTGLLNHSNLKERISTEILRAKRINSFMCFAMIDVDHFKKVNDTYGHPVGDMVLKSLSRLLQERLRRTDIIGRYGGEEFGVILLNTDGESAKKVMDEVRDNFSKIRHQSEKDEFYVTFSCGIACFPKYDNPESLNISADKALYAAKEGGRNRTVLNCEQE